jgi:hypothetical protein
MLNQVKIYFFLLLFIFILFSSFTYRFFIIYIDGSTAGAAENENFSRRLGAVELVQIYLEETLCSDDKRRKSFDKDIPNSWVIESHTVAINLSSMVLIS